MRPLAQAVSRVYNKEYCIFDLTEWSITMRNVEDSSTARSAPAGWMVKVGREYYTGSGRSAFERWTPFRQFAKVYRRKGWAQKIATQLGGQIVAVAGEVNGLN
jgi:hypothetical protein